MYHVRRATNVVAFRSAYDGTPRDSIINPACRVGLYHARHLWVLAVILKVILELVSGER